MVVAMSMSSCADEQVQPNVGIYVDPMTGQVRLSVSIGYPGYPPMYGYPMYGQYFSNPMSGQVSVAYIMSQPMNQNAIQVFDSQGNPMGVVNCVTGDWRECNRLYDYIRHWNYSHPFVVLVRWTGFGEGDIIG